MKNRECPYLVKDFSKSKTIAVICRGSSANYVKEKNSKWTECYTVGQFSRGLMKLERALKGKNIVYITNKCSFGTKEKIFNKFGIQDIQCNIGGWKSRELTVAKKKRFEKIVKRNPWAKVHLSPVGIKENRPPDPYKKKKIPNWSTTGDFAVDLATWWKPKNIYIYGLDFYTGNYFAKEKVNISIKKNSPKMRSMIKHFFALVDRDKDIIFTIYTKCKSLHRRGRKNLRVRHV